MPRLRQVLRPPSAFPVSFYRAKLIPAAFTHSSYAQLDPVSKPNEDASGVCCVLARSDARDRGRGRLPSVFFRFGAH